MLRFLTAIALAAFLTCQTATADKITLLNGDVLTGTIIEQTDGQVTFSHTALGQMTIPRAQIDAIETTAAKQAQVPGAGAEKPAEEGEAAEAALPAVEEAPPIRPGLFGTSFLRGWEKQLTLGLSGKQGESDTVNITAAFTGLYENTDDRWSTSLRYFLDSNNDGRSRNEFAAELTKDWLIPGKPWFWYATGTYEYDEFRTWEHRVSGFGGVGYEFLKEEPWTLLGRAGGGVKYEFDGINELEPEAMLGLEGSYKINGSQKVTFYNNLFPSLSDVGEFRNLTGIEWVADIERGEGMKVKVGVLNEYESEPNAGGEYNDLKYYAAIAYDF